MAKKHREWKYGEKHGLKGTVRAMITHHPEKFDADCKDKDKLCPYAIASSKKIEPHYKNQESTVKGKPVKKSKFKEWVELRECPHPAVLMGGQAGGAQVSKTISGNFEDVVRELAKWKGQIPMSAQCSFSINFSSEQNESLREFTSDMHWQPGECSGMTRGDCYSLLDRNNNIIATAVTKNGRIVSIDGNVDEEMKRELGQMVQQRAGGF